MVTEHYPRDAAARARRIALVVTDNDGVLTDGTVYVSAAGEQLKAYSVRDGMGVERLRQHGIATGVLTASHGADRAARRQARAPSPVDRRARQARSPRADPRRRRRRDRQLVYVGDDLNDLEIIEAIGAHA